MKMMKLPETIKGYLNIFPNYLHANRKDGYGCATLSPKSIGPITAYGLPVAQNLENFHQFSKFYEFEVDPITNKIKPDAIQYRIKGFNDKVPHRHKFDNVKDKALF